MDIQKTIGNVLKRKRGNLLLHTILIIGSVSMILPFVWMLLTSFKTFGESMAVPIVLFPAKLRPDSYEKVLDILPFGSLYYNTIALIFWRVVCATVFSSMAAFAFAKLEFPFRNTLFILVLVQFMLPPQIYIIPQYLLLAKFQLLNSMFALVFPGLISTFGTFFLRQYYLSLPNELSEAAKIDGCSIGKTFLFILLPLTKTALMALTIFTALFAYRDMMWPLIVNMKLEMMTLSAGISTLVGAHVTEYPDLMAASTLAIFPMLILYLVIQRRFVEGIALSGSKT